MHGWMHFAIHIASQIWFHQLSSRGSIILPYRRNQRDYQRNIQKWKPLPDMDSWF